MLSNLCLASPGFFSRLAFCLCWIISSLPAKGCRAVPAQSLLHRGPLAPNPRASLVPPFSSVKRYLVEGQFGFMKSSGICLEEEEKSITFK